MILSLTEKLSLAVQFTSLNSDELTTFELYSDVGERYPESIKRH